MIKRKLLSTFSTSLDRVVSEKLLLDMERCAPHETVSSLLRFSLSFVLAVGLDAFVNSGLLYDDSNQIMVKASDKVRELLYNLN